jgi:hypothetical protein
MNNTWQLCPKCNGEGLRFNLNGTTCTTSAICDVCNGKKIISQIMGLPPAFQPANEGEIELINEQS